MQEKKHLKKIAKSVTHKVEKVGEKAKSKVSSVSSAGKNGSDKGSPEGGTPEKLDNRYWLVQKFRPRGSLTRGSRFFRLRTETPRLSAQVTSRNSEAELTSSRGEYTSI